MIIVSQDKYNILNFDTTVNIGVEEITTLNDIVQISAQTNGNTIVLGKYETEERAKEVLKEIINTYQRNAIIKITSDKDTQDRIFDMLNEADLDFDIYEMPKK